MLEQLGQLLRGTPFQDAICALPAAPMAGDQEVPQKTPCGSAELDVRNRHPDLARLQVPRNQGAPGEPRPWLLVICPHVQHKVLGLEVVRKLWTTSRQSSFLQKFGGTPYLPPWPRISLACCMLHTTYVPFDKPGRGAGPDDHQVALTKQPRTSARRPRKFFCLSTLVSGPDRKIAVAPLEVGDLGRGGAILTGL